MSPHVATGNKSGPKGRAWHEKTAQDAAARDKLEQGVNNPGPIAVIDMGQVIVQTASGKEPVHRDLAGEDIVELQPLLNPSKSGHGAEVVGLIAASCDAPIEYYNAWTEAEFSMDAFKAALVQIAQSDARILNLSIGIEEDFDPQDRQEITRLLKDYMAADRFVVAAVGETGKNQAAFPANINGVIAVGAITPHDRPISFSNGGAIVAAPGESIDVLEDKDAYRKQDGSSYAAAQVSAALWLVLRNEPNPTPARLESLLDASVRPPKGPDPAKKVGKGQLDLRKLADQF